VKFEFRETTKNKQIFDRWSRIGNEIIQLKRTPRPGGAHSDRRPVPNPSGTYILAGVNLSRDRYLLRIYIYMYVCVFILIEYLPPRDRPRVFPFNRLPARIYLDDNTAAINEYKRGHHARERSIYRINSARYAILLFVVVRWKSIGHVEPLSLSVQTYYYYYYHRRRRYIERRVHTIFYVIRIVLETILRRLVFRVTFPRVHLASNGVTESDALTV